LETDTRQLADLNFQLRQLDKQEHKLLFEENPLAGAAKKAAGGKLDQLQDKIPSGLEKTVRKAMQTAFRTVFAQGRGIIDKTYNRQDLHNEYADKRFQAQTGRRRREEGGLHGARTRYWGQMGFTTAKGLGLGLLGIGLPDIPLLIGELIRICIVSAESYGLDPDREDEKVYMLRLISLAAASGDDRRRLSQEADTLADRIDRQGSADCRVDGEIDRAADALTASLLVSRFVMGMPVVGVAGGLYDSVIVNRMHRLAEIKYKRRFLNRCKDNIMRQIRDQEQG
jgi:hypothetical protein